MFPRQHSWRLGSHPAILIDEVLNYLCSQAVRETVDAGRVAELEAAQAAAQGALLAEMDLLRRQKAAAEEQARRLETQVHSLPHVHSFQYHGVLRRQPAKALSCAFFRGGSKPAACVWRAPDAPHQQHQGGTA